MKDQLNKLNQLGEKALIDGSMLVFPGETPATGDPVTVVDTEGNEAPAPDGTHETTDGWLITTMSSEITEILEPEMMENNNEDIVNELKAKMEIVKLQKQVEELNKKLSSEPAAQPIKTFSSENTVKIGDDRKLSKKALLDLSRQYRQIRKNPQQFNRMREEYRYLNGSNFQQFATGWDLTNVLARCKDYLNEIIYVTLVNDGILSMANNITPQATGGAMNKYNVYIPRMDFSPDSQWWQQVAKTCGFTPSGTWEPSQREVEVHGIQFEHEQCAIDTRNVWNGMIYNGEEEIPAEAVLTDMITQRLAQDLERIALYGRGSINGLFKEIQNAVIAGCIPAAQSLTQVAYTNANAIDQIDELIDAVPPFLRANPDLFAMVQYNLPTLYYRNYRTAFGSPPQFGYPLAPQEGMNELIPDTPFPTSWFKSYSQGLEPVGTDLVNITFPQNIYYVLENSGAENDFDVWFEKTEQLIRFRWRNCFGINFALCEGIVTNITATTVLP